MQKKTNVRRNEDEKIGISIIVLDADGSNGDRLREQ